MHKENKDVQMCFLSVKCNKGLLVGDLFSAFMNLQVFQAYSH